MKNEIVIFCKDGPRMTSTVIAAMLERRHEQIVRFIKKYREQFEDLNTIKVFKKVYGRGRPIQEFQLTESQFMFLGTLLDNTEKTVRLKHAIIKAFQRAKRILAAAQSQHTDQKWIMSRDFGKEQRLEATDSIKEFVAYAKAQGSKSADWYFTSITRMMNGLLFISGGKFKNLRNVLTAKQLMTIASAEQIISKGLRDGMKANTFYKDIYKSIKKNTLDFAGLTGQTQVIEDQLKLEE